MKRKRVGLICAIACMVFLATQAQNTYAASYSQKTFSESYFLGSLTAYFDWSYDGTHVLNSSGYATTSGIAIAASTYRSLTFDTGHDYRTFVMRGIGLDVNASYGGISAGWEWSEETFETYLGGDGYFLTCRGGIQ